MNKAPKFVVVIDHKATYHKSFTHIAINADNMATALVEASLVAIKKEEVHCWVVCRKLKDVRFGGYYRGEWRCHKNGTVEDVRGEENWKNEYISYTEIN